MAIPRGRLLSVSALCVLLALALACLCAGAGTASAADTKPYIVVFEKSSAAGARAATSDIASDEHFKTSQRYDDAVHGFAARLDKHDLEAVRDDPRVAKVVVDKPVTATAVVGLASGDNAPLGVRRVGAATASTAREASTANVAVIDTGVDLTHPDLNAAAGVNCVGGGSPNDDNGHGTHVAGIIGAKNQGSGAVGVAPGTRIYAVKVLNASGSGYTSQIICGIDWVTATRTDGNASNDIAVANMSLGGSSSFNDNCGRTVGDPEHIAICNSIAAGVTYVVAAGNSTRDESTFAPANYPEVLTVTAVSDSDGVAGGAGGTLSCTSNADDTPASYSNFATRSTENVHTIAAPGTCIRSTYMNGQYATLSGTSMASPHVTGLVALCMGEAGAQGPCWGKTPAQVRSMMLAAAQTTAAEAPGNVFSGSPTRPITGRYYGEMASTRFPSAAGVAPAWTAAPVVTGTASTSGTLSATHGTWTGSGLTYAYQWVACTNTTTLASCSDIAGATGATYQPAMAVGGKYLRVRVIASNSDGAAAVRSLTTAAIAAPVAPVNTAAPSIAGYPQLTRTMTAKPGTWTGTATITYAYQWERCTTTAVASCSQISGATGTTYAPVTADLAKYIRVAVTATNARSSVLARSVPTAVVTNPAAPVVTAPVNTVLPSLAGMAVTTHTMTFKSGSWTGTSPSYTYQWLRCTTTIVGSCVNIAGSTGTSYLVTAGDTGKYLRIAITATNGAGTVTAKSNAVGPVT
jgi:subtilisin family serine protease